VLSKWRYFLLQNLLQGFVGLFSSWPFARKVVFAEMFPEGIIEEPPDNTPRPRIVKVKSGERLENSNLILIFL